MDMIEQRGKVTMKMTEIASFSVKFLQYLNENGEVVQELPALAQDHETLRMLYQKMTLVRYFDKKAVALQRTGNLGTFPSLLGQEAIPVTMGYAMGKEDVLCPNYRNQGELLMLCYAQIIATKVNY
jgi:pyruvate dehydrogenase E1 component alpha subunit